MEQLVIDEVAFFFSLFLLRSATRHRILWAGLKLKPPEKGVWGPRQPGWFQGFGELAEAGAASKGVEVSLLPFLVWIQSSEWGEQRLGMPGLRGSTGRSEAKRCPGCLGQRGGSGQRPVGRVVRDVPGRVKWPRLAYLGASA